MRLSLTICFFFFAFIAAYSQGNQLILVASNASANIHLQKKILLKSPAVDLQRSIILEEATVALPGKFGGGDGGGSSIAEAMSQPLPIELIYFRGAPNESSILLQWETAQEMNNDVFIIEKKTTTNEFVEIGKVNSLGNSTHKQYYSFLDNEPDVGSNYYRLKQIDLDEKYVYSNIVCIQVFTNLNNVHIQPNPFSESIFIDSQKNIDGSLIEIFDTSGVLVFMSYLNDGSLNLDKLTPGVYYLKINGETHKIIKK